MYIEENSLDDIVHKLLTLIREQGTEQNNSKGENKEILGMYVKLTNPLNRISTSFEKNIFVSPLGEFFWYMAGSNKLEFIQYYLSKYDEFSNDKEILNGAYGARLFNKEGSNLSQVSKIITLLREKNTTRQAVIQIFDQKDLEIEKNLDVPCTCNLQFFIRNNKLVLFVTMRSNDVFVGLPHDIFCFTMLQEIVAKELNIELGDYNHFISSCHFYKKDEKKIAQYLDEGLQTTKTQMESMPNSTCLENFQIILTAENEIRNGIDVDVARLELSNYWSDILYILKIFQIKTKNSKNEFKKKVPNILSYIKNENYKTYINEKYNLHEKQ